MPNSITLSKMDPNSFEHMVNLLAMRVLGLGHTGFGPGSDGGRDGFFEGETFYPSAAHRWKGRWYIQSKFHAPHLSRNPQKWLIEQIQREIKEFTKTDTKRKWPDNWIIATNIEPSGAPMTGAFDRAHKLVSKARPRLKNRFHIWGGSKITDLLVNNPEVRDYYAHFLTPGDVLTELYAQLKDAQAEVKTILRFLIVKHFGEQQHTKLEQAGSAADTRPGIHRLFIDLPFRANAYSFDGHVTEHLVKTAARNHRVDPKQPDTKEWRLWNRFPSRARVWFVRGGPGQGKSTIAQYFSQIQRAALILQGDGPRVLPQQRAIAKEIERTAKTQGFWPSVPRIPISIELKEYAQWYGLRPKKYARGVLTYLAERISASVEQKVLVGTLRRALQTRSWVVVFDGLDEVPHDVKDQVALEVRNFVDDVVIENDADLLTICTSRPQGYSGQFSNLDGPTIDLVSLSTSQALACARPVLELDRSEDEAQKTIQILKSAIQSGSVQELMTTPLQSHIMAVVVRDGGRPPDRRWQLFTNFYHVIKRREANRDLPDKRLARLLREDNQLLKTVHNRLGFALHASAETSKGAQTHLSRAQFETLVKDAVSEMIEGDISETVNVLMEATTDRLVLVSTPDDGNHVRFDIRPLQEFFAAEFLYESVSSEVLHNRMETVSGDAHWREVIHFLVSALVENSRLTELSVSVDVLERLNHGTAESQLRMLSRRLGRGALLVARLVHEGVMEQDKRIRQQFRKCIEPITAFTDPDVLLPLGMIGQPNSRAWFLNFLIDSLREDDETESVGAAILLTHYLPDGHIRLNEVKGFLRSASRDYLRIVLSLRSRERIFAQSTPIQYWLADLVFELLARSDWTGFDNDAIEGCINILSNAKDVIERIARERNLDNWDLHALGELRKSSGGRPGARVDVDYGFIKGYHLPHDWRTGYTSPAYSEEELGRDSSEIGGLFNLLRDLYRFALRRTPSDLRKIIRSLDSGRANAFSALPSYIRAFFPTDPSRSFGDHLAILRSLDDKELQHLIQEGRVGNRKLQRPVVWFQLGQTYDLDHWKDLIKSDPSIALNIWSESFWNRIHSDVERPEILDNKEVVELLVDLLLENAELLIIYPQLWGRLLENSARKRSNLRRQLLEASIASPPAARQWGRAFEFHPFALNLPIEAPLLPHFCGALSDQHSFKIVDAFNYSDSHLDRESVGDLIAQLASSDELSALIEKPLPPSTRVAAVFLCLLHSSGKVKLEQVEQKIVDLYFPEIGVWYFKALRMCLELLEYQHHPCAKILISKVLEVSRADYLGRQQLERLLKVWRETSNAPVQSGSLQSAWLAATGR